MENKINIAELLKDCPRGMELDCVIFNDVTLECVSDEGIWIKYIDSNSKSRVIYLTSYGGMDLQYIETKCIIFPRGKTTWEGFVPPCQFKNGDIIYNQCIRATAIFYKQTDDITISHCFLNMCRELRICHHHCKLLYDWRLATEEEKQKLFDAIKANGYHWNAETKTLEKLPKFKVGNRIKEKKGEKIAIVERVYKDYYDIRFDINNGIGSFTIDLQDEWELVIEKPIFKIGNKIKPIGLDRHYIIENIESDRYILNNDNFLRFNDEHNFELVPNKFDITTLVPFESMVLVRDNDFDHWKPSFWGYLRESEIQYDTIRGAFRQCIPYEGNEHLMKTTNDCDEFFKTWKK